ncbi:MAG: amidohydrolase [Bifidobacteriaceae bacterium]|jgi:4-oxalmesaconate hydratase|nr:amidohydrolase [Bifidobacteriaceae bacterium]
MIVDVHAHYTMAPPELLAYRGTQLAQLNKPRRKPLTLSDERVEQSLAGLFAAMDAREVDVLAFSPRAAGMGHDLGSEAVSRAWTEVCNDLVAQACALAPTRLIPVCQLPQSPGAPITGLLEEVDRRAAMGFAGCLVNPDVTGGEPPWTPSLGDEWWYPLWEALSRLEMPAMIHASATRNPAMHMNASHYVAWDLAATVELCASKVFDDFPTLKIIVPHGGGAVPYQFNRLRAVHAAERRAPFEEMARRLWFDTAVYDQDSLKMLIDKVGSDRVVFGSEMFGTGKAIDPVTGAPFDNNLPLIEGLGLAPEERQAILCDNAKTLFNRAAVFQGERL